VSPSIFIATLVGIGILGGVIHIAATLAAFRWARTPAEAAGRSRITVVDLVAALAAVVVSGAVLLAIVFIAATWTNRYPEFKGNKDALWLGYVGAVALWSFTRKRRGGG
jgi:hypothetical protein